MKRAWNIRRPIVAGVLAIIVVSVLARGEGLAPEEQTFFDKHISDVIQIVPTKVNDAAFLKVFSAPFYAVKLTITEGDGSEGQDLVLVRIGDKLVSAMRPGSDTDLPDYPKMMNPDFKLKTDDDAKTLQQALDVAYPIVGDSDKKLEGFRHNGTQWIMVRGAFFDSQLGYIFEVDGDGAIKSVKFALKLPPK